MENKEELNKAFYDQLILGESCVHVTKDGVERLDPLSPEYQTLYNIIYNRIEDKLAEAWKNQDPNKSYLPKEYNNENKI